MYPTADVPPELATAVAAMRAFQSPWCVAGGWALDLFLGRPTRAHADVDLALFRDDQLHLRRHLAGWTFRKVVDGRLVRWPAGEWLSAPVHELHAQSLDDPPVRLEFLLNERSGDRWVYRRDPGVECPVGEAILVSALGIPVLCPAIVLLYKARQPRGDDERDFHAVLQHLDYDQRQWLRAALLRVNARHPWLAHLHSEVRRGA